MDISTSATVSPPSSTTGEAAPSIKTYSTPDPPAKSTNPLSTWFSPSQAKQSRQPKSPQGNKSTPVTEKSGSSTVFGSTWGASDSFWGSYFGSPGSSDQGGAGGGGKDKSSGGEGIKEAPKPASMARGVGARKLKSQTSSSNKTQSSEQRKKVTSPRLTSPPKSSSTPLPQPKEKEKSSTSEGMSIEKSSGMASDTTSSKPEQNVATPKSSSKSQSTGKTLVKASEGEEGEAGSSEGGTEVKAKKPNNENLKSIATPEPSEHLKDLKDAAVLEATDTGSTAAESNTLTVVELTASTQEETNTHPDVSSPPLSVEDSKTKDVELTRKSSSPQSLSSPTAAAHSSIEQEDTTHQVPSQTENGDGLSVVQHETQHDSIDTQQITAEQNPLTNQTKQENDQNSTEQDMINSCAAEQSPSENREHSTKVAETKDSTSPIQQLQISGDRQTTEPERGQSPSSVVVQVEVEGEKRQQPVNNKQKDDSTLPKEKAAAKESMEHPDIDRLKKVVCYNIVCVCSLIPRLPIFLTHARKAGEPGDEAMCMYMYMCMICIHFKCNLVSLL